MLGLHEELRALGAQGLEEDPRSMSEKNMKTHPQTGEGPSSQGPSRAPWAVLGVWVGTNPRSCLPFDLYSAEILFIACMAE